MDYFVLKVILSIVIGIIWVVVSTILAERFSGKIGGLIVGLPSTAVISLLFVGLTQGDNAATIAATVIPFSSGLYCFYFLSFLTLSKKGFWYGFTGSLLVWFMAAFISSRYAPDSLIISVAVWLIFVSSSIYWVIKKIKIKHTLIPSQITASPLWLKAVITGSIIGFIVILSKIAGPRWGGIFATFPALTASTILITVKSGGTEFTRLIAKNVLISTTVTIGLYAVLGYMLFPIAGIIVGSVVAYIGLLLICIPIYFFFLDKFNN